MLLDVGGAFAAVGLAVAGFVVVVLVSVVVLRLLTVVLPSEPAEPAGTDDGEAEVDTQAPAGG